MQGRPYIHTVRKGDAAQPYFWHTKAGNGELVASSHDQYTTAAAALHGLHLFSTNAASAPVNDRTDTAGDGRIADFEFEVDHDVNGKFIWRFQAPNNRIIATGAEPFSSKRAALNAIERVKENLARAEVEDETGDPVDVEACTTAGVRPPRARRYQIRVDRDTVVMNEPTPTGREVLEAAQRLPATQYQLYLKLRGGQTRAVALDEKVDLTSPGVERFQTIEHTVTDGCANMEVDHE